MLEIFVSVAVFAVLVLVLVLALVRHVGPRGRRSGKVDDRSDFDRLILRSKS